MNVYKDMRKKRRLRAEKEIQDAYRNLDQISCLIQYEMGIQMNTDTAAP